MNNPITALKWIVFMNVRDFVIGLLFIAAVFTGSGVASIWCAENSYPSFLSGYAEPSQSKSVRIVQAERLLVDSIIIHVYPGDVKTLSNNILLDVRGLDGQVIEKNRTGMTIIAPEWYIDSLNQIEYINKDSSGELAPYVLWNNNPNPAVHNKDAMTKANIVFDYKKFYGLEHWSLLLLAASFLIFILWLVTGCVGEALAPRIKEGKPASA